jgi:hypothetical protein
MTLDRLARVVSHWQRPDDRRAETIVMLVNLALAIALWAFIAATGRC